jgi:exosortase/archaeosortase family protein
MRSSLLRRAPLLVFALHAAAFWPVWRWYIARTGDGSDEPWGIAALVTALVMTWPRKMQLLQSADRLLLAGALLTLIYVVITPLAPPLLRAASAMAALACTWVCIAGARDKLPAVALLFALSLPIMASVQFYAGFPLRTLAAIGTHQLLTSSGMDITREGTALLWNGKTVLIDAPCSGVRMLWTGATLCGALALMRSAIAWRALIELLACALPVLLLANTLRGAALFLLEIREVPPPAAVHDAVGIATFVLACAGLVGVDALLQRRGGARRPIEVRALGMVRS